MQVPRVGLELTEPRLQTENRLFSLLVCLKTQKAKVGRSQTVERGGGAVGTVSAPVRLARWGARRWSEGQETGQAPAALRSSARSAAANLVG